MVARRLSQEVKIKGFRPGKAPLPVVEATVGSETVRKEAIDEVLPRAVSEILESEELRPALNPELVSLEETEGKVEAEVRVALWPKVELPEYKGRKIEVTNPKVSDEELGVQIERMLEQFATVEEVDREARERDYVSIDIEATLDGEVVEGTVAADLLYEVGSGLLIEGMDSHLLGASAGDEFIFEAELPEGFGDRAGELATFTVKVNEVKERVLPDLTDEWVEENTEFETVEGLRAALKDQLEEAKLQAVSREFADKAVDTLREQVEVDIPEALIRAEMDNQLHRFVHRLEEYDLSLDDYFQSSGITEEAFVADLRSQAEISLRTRLVLEAVAGAEGIEVTAEDVIRLVQALAVQSEKPEEFIEAFRESGQELVLAGDILRNRALDAVLAAATPVDEEGNPVELKPREVEAEIVDGGVSEAPVVAAEVVEEEE
ncbi:MAG TPA: trigger factor [Acidimicrobiia bacterium]|nr:trigger factor [Acidimicrobiia bacterium]